MKELTIEHDFDELLEMKLAEIFGYEYIPHCEQGGESCE